MMHDNNKSRVNQEIGADYRVASNNKVKQASSKSSSVAASSQIHSRYHGHQIDLNPCCCDNLQAKQTRRSIPRVNNYATIIPSLLLINLLLLGGSLAGVGFGHNGGLVAEAWSLFGASPSVAVSDTLAPPADQVNGLVEGGADVPVSGANEVAGRAQEPFLLLLSPAEIALVKLPLIENGQISTIFKTQSAATSQDTMNISEEKQPAEEAEDTNSASKQSDTRDGSPNSGDKTAGEQTQANNSATSTSSDASPSSSDATAAAAPLTSNEQMRRKKRSATSLGKSPALAARLNHRNGSESQLEQTWSQDGSSERQPLSVLFRKRRFASKREATSTSDEPEPQQQIAAQAGSSTSSASFGSSSSQQQQQQHEQLVTAGGLELNDFDVHMQQGLVFASDGRGRIHRIQLEVAARLSDNSAAQNSDASSNEISASSQASSSLSASANGNNDISKQTITPASGEEADERDSGDDLPPAKAKQAPELRFAGQHPSASGGSGAQSQPTAATTMAKLSNVIWSSQSRIASTTIPKHGARGRVAAASGSQQQLAGEPANATTLLAVDWLNEALFVLDGNRLFCIDFEGGREILLIDDFVDTQRPLQMRLDPANNFLFWLQAGRFHASIYRLDLGVLLSNRELTMERMRTNMNMSSTSEDNSGSGGGKTRKSFDVEATVGVDKREALISRHYAHPIITNLPKQTKLFLIDHKHSRIYVPIAQSGNSQTNTSACLGQLEAENGCAEMQLTSSGADSLVVDSKTTSSSATSTCGQILTYNLDSTDAGPLRSDSERDHWSAFQPGADMQDLGLDSDKNLLYWLTSGGRAIFEEYLENGTLHSAQHTLDVTTSSAYTKLIYFSPANQPKKSTTSTTTSAIGTLLKMMADYQQQQHPTNNLSSKYKKSIYGSDSTNEAAQAYLLVHQGPSGDQRIDDSSRYFSPATPWFVFVGLGLLVFVLYSLLLERQRRTMLENNQNTSNHSSPSPDALSSLLGTGTITRWLQSKQGGVTSSASLDANSQVSASSGVNRISPSYALDLNHNNNRHQHQMLIGNAIDEHYGEEQQHMGAHDTGASGLPHLSKWPSSISDFTNKLYVPIEVMQDKELASIRRISSDKLDIDRNSAPLGQGHFGTVLQGVIKNCSASERAEWLAPASCRSNQSTPNQLNQVSSNGPNYENQSRLESLLMNMRDEQNNAGDILPAPAPLGSGSSSGHGSTSNSDVFMTAQQASSVSACGTTTGANTGDYLTPKSQCGQSSISDYDDRITASIAATSAIANPNYMFATATTSSNSQTGNMSLYEQTSISGRKAVLLLKPFKVAIKKLKDNPTPKEKEDFLQEAKLLAKFNHRNIVQLIGICLDRGNTLIVMELMLGGDLIRYMRKNCEKNVMLLEEDDLLSICLDIVDGCCYLAEMNYIHRDLAARNCLVSSCRKEERVVKLADFGLARDIYEGNYYKQLNPDSAMPLKWMAPECFCGEPTFTSQSDVWSFGVVMWEVTNYCLQTPYSSVAPMKLKEHFEAGKRLEKSEHCDGDLYKLMLQCWQIEPERRPTFRECQIELIEIRNKLQKKQQQQHYLQQPYQYHYHHQQCEI